MPIEGETGAQLVSGSAKLTFTWRGDRFEHTLESPQGRLIALSNAGGIETPVFTELHQQGDLLFASGMSGDRHWSASIEPIVGGFLLDVACRAKTLAEGLGVVYEGVGLWLESDPTDPDAPTNVAAAGDGQVVVPLAEHDSPPVTVRMRYRVVAS